MTFWVHWKGGREGGSVLFENTGEEAAKRQLLERLASTGRPKAHIVRISYVDPMLEIGLSPTRRRPGKRG